MRSPNTRKQPAKKPAAIDLDLASTRSMPNGRPERPTSRARPMRAGRKAARRPAAFPLVAPIVSDNETGPLEGCGLLEADEPRMIARANRNITRWRSISFARAQRGTGFAARFTILLCLVDLGFI